MRLCNINSDFINHFNQYIKNLGNEINDTLLEFLGLNRTNYNIVMVSYNRIYLGNNKG